MKIIFRATVIILLIAILVVSLFRKKQQVEIDTSNAKSGNYEIPVHVAKVQSSQPFNAIKAGGMVESIEEVIVVSTAQGRLTSIQATIGKKFNENEILATIDDYYAVQEYTVAKEAALQTEKDLNRYKKLAVEDAVAKQQLEQLQLQFNAAYTKQNSLLKRVADFKIKSPISGVINQVFVKTGATVGAGTPICEIVNPNGLRIAIHVEKNDLLNLRVGTEVNISENSGQGAKYSGSIIGIGVKPDRTGRFPVSIATSGNSKKLEPGTAVYVEIPVSNSNIIILPRKLIVIRNGIHGVFVSENNSAVFKEIQTGKDFGNDVEVLSGVEEGELVITDGYQFLEVGNKIKSITE